MPKGYVHFTSSLPSSSLENDDLGSDNIGSENNDSDSDMVSVVVAYGETSARQSASEVADVGSNDELSDAKTFAAGEPGDGTREVAQESGVAQDGFEQRLWAIEGALLLKGSAKGKNYEERIWQPQKTLSIKCSGKGKPLDERLRIIEGFAPGRSINAENQKQGIEQTVGVKIRSAVNIKEAHNQKTVAIIDTEESEH